MKVLGEINRGGFGRVERVQLGDGTIVARKVFDPILEIIATTDDAKLKKRFQREVHVQSLLSSDYFIPILETGLDARHPWFTMPLAERNFWQQIQESRKNGTIPTEALADILNALEELHSLGYVHRDLKPHNILLHDGHWKLADFGLVMPLRGTTTKLTSLDSAWGTEEYCAPEQAEDFRNATPSVDIYAFGCILHDLFIGTSRVPYQQYDGPSQIGMVIKKCTELNPKKRFKNIAALRGTLLAILSESQSLTPSPNATEWAESLQNLSTWNGQKFEEFARFIKRTTDPTDLAVVFLALDEDALGALHAMDEELWQVVAIAYCDWAHGSFGFDYCDVIIRRLEVIFELGNFDCKAASALAAANLGAYHHRFFVMKRLVRMCGPSLDSQVAQRIAIEIRAEEATLNFKVCAEVIRQCVEDYHPVIAGVLRDSY